MLGNASVPEVSRATRAGRPKGEGAKRELMFSSTEVAIIGSILKYCMQRNHTGPDATTACSEIPSGSTQIQARTGGSCRCPSYMPDWNRNAGAKADCKW